MPQGHYRLKRTPDGQVILLQEMGKLGLKQKDLVQQAGIHRSTLYFQVNPRRGKNKEGTTRVDTAYRLATVLARHALGRPPTDEEQERWLTRCFESLSSEAS